MKRIIVVITLIVTVVLLFCSCRQSKTTTVVSQVSTMPNATSAVTIEAGTTEKKVSADAKKRQILKAYKATLVENIYHYDDSRADELPTYALYDFDKDGTSELLVWDIRVASATFRDIYVYRYNAVTDKSEHIGTMVDFTGHSLITEASDDDGIVIAIRDSGKQDRITKYTLTDGRLTPTIMIERTDEDSQEWYCKIESDDYNSKITLETANTYNVLEDNFG